MERVIMETPLQNNVEGTGENLIKHSGKYGYVETKYEGIKKVVSISGKKVEKEKFLVFLDYGTKDIFNKEKGCIEKKQNKTAKVVDGIKKAQKLRAEAEIIRAGGDIRTVGGYKLTIGDAIKDYMSTARFNALNPNYIQMQENVFRHFMDYFTGVEPHKITSIDIENYYEWSRRYGNRTLVKKGEERKKSELSINTVTKHKSVLKMLFDYMIESKKYGVKENIVITAKLPTITVNVAGVQVVKKKEEYQAKYLTMDELNYTLNDALQNEFDRSIALIIALSAIGSLRRGEIVGMQVGKFYRGKLMCVHDSVFESTCYDKELYLSRDDIMMVDRAINYIKGKRYIKLPKRDRIRVSSIPRELRNIVDYCMEQRQEVYDIIGKEIEGTDYLYCPLVNLIKGSMPVSTKVTKKWMQYQKRRNERMIAQGLEPIPIVRLHDLRHTHSNNLRGKVHDSEISYNMGHVMGGENTTKRVYWNDGKMDRKEIIDYFNEHIKIDWSKAMRKKINDSNKIKLNGSGHLIVAQDEIEKVRKFKKKYIYTEEELVELMNGKALEFGQE